MLLPPARSHQQTLRCATHLSHTRVCRLLLLGHLSGALSTAAGIAHSSVPDHHPYHHHHDTPTTFIVATNVRHSCCCCRCRCSVATAGVTITTRSPLPPSPTTAAARFATTALAAPNPRPHDTTCQPYHLTHNVMVVLLRLCCRQGSCASPFSPPPPTTSHAGGCHQYTATTPATTPHTPAWCLIVTARTPHTPHARDRLCVTHPGEMCQKHFHLLAPSSFCTLAPWSWVHRTFGPSPAHLIWSTHPSPATPLPAHLIPCHFHGPAQPPKAQG